jgi:AcrR family transcriptional regulator
MAAGVKREYRSDLRAEQALQTRRAIVTAASQLFTSQGYGSTTVDAVAAEAGVSRKTVFTAVGGKLDLLKTALDWAVAGDDQPLALADRAAVEELLELADPELLIIGWVQVLVEIDNRVGPLLCALEVAAATDPEAQVLAAESQQQRLAGARLIVGRLAALGALRAGLSKKHAADIAWLASDAVLYDRLVRLRNWSSARFAKWLGDGLIDQLIGT